MKNRSPKASSIQKELPSQFADQLGVEYASSVDQSHKKRNGQFFTPVEIGSNSLFITHFLSYGLRPNKNDELAVVSGPASRVAPV